MSANATLGTVRLEAFSDGVIAILITIMVLELKVPHGEDPWILLNVWPVFASYVVSFLTIAVYWVNHHAMLHQARRCTPAVLWANIFWLFCLSLIPFATGYVGENHVSRFGATMYCGVLLLTGFGYLLLRMALAQEHRGNAAYHEAYCSASRKHYTAIAAYAVAMVVSWFLSPYVGFGMSFLVVAAYFIPNEWLGEAATEKA